MFNYWFSFPQISDRNLTLLTTSIIVGILIFMIVLFYIFQEKKSSLILQQKEKKQIYEKAIAQSQIEIKEQTLKNISWELHDNIGQLLTLAKIQIQNLEQKNADILEIQNTISKSLEELRSLSKVINSGYVNAIHLTKAIGFELDRIHRINLIEVHYEVIGENLVMDNQKEIIIFRILQEFFSNTLKYAQATSLSVVIDFKNTGVHILAKDNGIGFNVMNDTNLGIGLSSMKERGKLIEAKIHLTSEINVGTQLDIHLEKII